MGQVHAEGSYEACLVLPKSAGRLRNAVRKEKGQYLAMGIRPTYPSMKYGYIIPRVKEECAGLLPVARFVEKPSEDRAAELYAV